MKIHLNCIPCCLPIHLKPVLSKLDQLIHRISQSILKIFGQKRNQSTIKEHSAIIADLRRILGENRQRINEAMKKSSGDGSTTTVQHEIREYHHETDEELTGPERDHEEEGSPETASVHDAGSEFLNEIREYHHETDEELTGPERGQEEEGSSEAAPVHDAGSEFLNEIREYRRQTDERVSRLEAEMRRELRLMRRHLQLSGNKSFKQTD